MSDHNPLPGDDPYHDHKVYHKADLINRKTGDVSALCFKKPRAVNFKVELWTITDAAVTCPKCLAILNAGKPVEGQVAPVCKLCKSPLVKTSAALWACSRPDICKRPLVLAHIVEDALKAEEKRRAKHVKKELRGEPFEV